jgi:hypothetical protein
MPLRYLGRLTLVALASSLPVVGVVALAGPEPAQVLLALLLSFGLFAALSRWLRLLEVGDLSPVFAWLERCPSFVSSADGTSLRWLCGPIGSPGRLD